MDPSFTKRPMDQGSINNFNSLLLRTISTGECISCKVENYSDLVNSVYYCLTRTVSDCEYEFKVFKKSHNHFFQLHCQLMDGMIVYVKYDEDDFSVSIPTKQTEYGYWVEVPRKLIFNQRNKLLHSQNTVVVQFHNTCTSSFTRIPFAAFGRRTRRDEELFSQDMSKLYDIRNSTGDFLIIVGGKQFRVHKFVFDARTMWSKVNLFTFGSKVARITGEPHMMEKVIRYMYSGVLEKTDMKGMIKILGIAVNLEMTGLIQTLNATIIKLMSNDNVQDVFRIAKELEIIDLKYFATEYLNKQKSGHKPKKKVLKHRRRHR